MVWPPFDSEHLLVTAKQIADLEEQLFSSGLPAPSLMEKVGLAMFSSIMKKKDLVRDGVVVLFGPGHNGGDGLVVARELYLAGISVQIWSPFVEFKKLTLNHLDYCKWLGITRLNELPEIKSSALWIDAIFGLGQTRPLPQLLQDLFISRELATPGRLISLDVPSGICSNTGHQLSEGAAVASKTITIGLIKQGLVQDCAIKNVGRLERIDIGIKNSYFSDLPIDQPRLIASPDLSTFLWPKICPSAMKYQRGRTLVIAGSEKFPGASALALRGAIASGAGSIKGLLPKSLDFELWKMFPEVVFQKGFYKSDSLNLDFDKSLVDLDLSRVDSILIGPGLGLENGQESFSGWRDHLAAFKGLLVLDADALNQIAGSKEGFHWFKRRSGPTWITPHKQEFSRLFPMINKNDPVEAAKEAASLIESSILLKGAHSFAVDPSGKTWQLLESSPLVARCGLGDLLAGYVAGLGAIGFASLEALGTDLLAMAMLVHSEAARNCLLGSSPSQIASSLEALSFNLQGKNCAI